MEKILSLCDPIPANPGLKLREYRQLLGVTQEDIAYGVCSISKYSRIESGKEMPSVEEFSHFMNYFYKRSIYASGSAENHRDRKDGIDRHSLVVQLWNESKLDHWEKAGDLLSMYHNHFLSDASSENQIILFFELMHNYYTYDDFSGLELCRGAIETLQISRPYFSLDRFRVNFIPSSTEFLLLNAVACGLFESHQEVLYRHAILLLSDLIRAASDRRSCLHSNDILTALMINLCCFEADHNDLSEAGRHLEMIPSRFTSSGGLYLYSKSLRCEYFYYKKCGLSEKGRETLSTIRFVLSKMLNPPPFSSFIKNSPKIMVF